MSTRWRVTVSARCPEKPDGLAARIARFEGAQVEETGPVVTARFIVESPSVKRASRAALVIFERAVPSGEIISIAVDQLT